MRRHDGKGRKCPEGSGTDQMQMQNRTLMYEMAGREEMGNGKCYLTCRAARGDALLPSFCSLLELPSTYKHMHMLGLIPPPSTRGMLTG